MEALLEVDERVCDAAREAFLETLPEPQRKVLAELTEPTRHRMVFLAMWQRGRRPIRQAAAHDDRRGLARLRGQVEPETRKQLEAMPPADSGNWWPTGCAGMRHPGRGMHGPLPKDDDERLADFFEKELTDEERDRLLGLPGEEMQRELQQMYLMVDRRRKDRSPPRRLQTG